MKAPILAATDGTPPALGAIRVAYELAEGRGYPPHVVAVYEPAPMYGVPGYPLPSLAALDTQLQTGLREQVLAQVREVDRGEGPWIVHVEVGTPAMAIVRYAAQIGAEAIVLGIGRHTVADRLFGTETALKVAQLAHVPVLAVPPDATELPRRAVIAVDFSELSQDAASTVLRFLPDAAEVHLLHVAWSAPTLPELESAREWSESYKTGAKVRLQEMAQKLAADSRAQIITDVRTGDPASELLTYAKRTGADIIAAGRHGYGFFTRILMGSVSTRLLRGAQCTVLICPPRTAVEEVRQGQFAFAAPTTPYPI